MWGGDAVLSSCVLLTGVWPAGVAILIFDKKRFKRKLVRRDKEEYHILIKGKVHRKKPQFLMSMHQTQMHPSS